MLEQNQLGGALNLSGYSQSLQVINLEDNEITEIDPQNNLPSFQIRQASLFMIYFFSL